MVVEFVETRGAETSGVGGTEVYGAEAVHEGGLGGEVGAEGLVVVVASAEGCCNGAGANVKTLFVLGIASENVDALVDVARGGGKEVLTPVGTEDGGRSTTLIPPKGGKVEDSFQTALHSSLLFRLHVVADGIGLCLHFVLLAVAETVYGEVGLEGVLGRKLIDAANIPAQALVTHLVVVPASDVGPSVWTVSNLVRIVETGVEGKVLVGTIGELLADQVGAIASKEGCDALLGLGVGAFFIL